MTFTSLNFLLFFILIFILYYFILRESTKLQNWLLLAASYFFYGLADVKMVVLLITATIVFYFLGISLNKATQKKTEFLAALGVILGIGLLFYFKYLNFFIESFSHLFTTLGLRANVGTFNIILPVGISFFTFKLISYIIEIRRGKIKPATNFVNFATYIAFFPTILSGPIDRPNDFIPQLKINRQFDYNLVVDGCRQILWGLFQKLVIADNFSMLINSIWGDIPSQSASTLFIAAILFSIQLYTDFSGYSHIAIGLGKVLGLRITRNFNYPYFSRNMAEFWRNWHMSLTSWLTDYIFIPLNIRFRKLGNLGMIIAIIINMTIVGLWHGASWTYIVFGFLHGLLFIPLIISGSIFSKKKLKINKFYLPPIRDFFKIIFTFFLWTFSLIIFKAENLGQVSSYFSGIAHFSILSFPKGLGEAKIPLFFSLFLFSFEWFSRYKEYPLSALELQLAKWQRPILYFAIIMIIFYFGNFGTNQFIYFKF